MADQEEQTEGLQQDAVEAPNEEQIETSLQMIQQLLEMLGEAWNTIDELKSELKQVYENEAKRSVEHAKAGREPSLAQSSLSAMGEGVFIVDDSQILVMRLRQLVEQLNYKVIGSAGSAEQAFDMLKVLNPRVIILDHQLPQMTGLEFLRELRKRDQEVKVMVCSGNLTLQVGREFVTAGANELLAKPIQLDQFIKSLRRCMSDLPEEFM